MNIEEFAKKAIGIPFLPHGRNWNGWDCWGELCVGFKEVLDITLPDYRDMVSDLDIIKDKDEIETVYEREKRHDWIQVKRCEPMDVLLIFMYGRACHVGLVINKQKFLHVEHGINTCMQRIKDFRIEGIYKYIGK